MGKVIEMIWWILILNSFITKNFMSPDIISTPTQQKYSTKISPSRHSFPGQETHLIRVYLPKKMKASDPHPSQQN